MRPINKLVIFDCLLSMCFLKVPSLDEAKGFVVVNFVKSAFIHEACCWVDLSLRFTAWVIHKEDWFKTGSPSSF